MTQKQIIDKKNAKASSLTALLEVENEEASPDITERNPQSQAIS